MVTRKQPPSHQTALYTFFSKKAFNKRNMRLPDQDNASKEIGSAPSSIAAIGHVSDFCSQSC